MRTANTLMVIIIILTFAVSIYFYPNMPEKVASHWNAKGEVDDYLPKFWGIFLLPLVSIGILLLFIAIPRIDPLKENIEKFRKHYDGFILLMMIFFFYIQLLIILSNIGVEYNMSQAIMPAIAIIFYYAGVLMDNAEQNWFVGIRTPWTLSSKKVWDKTHKRGSKLFKILAIITLISMFFIEYLVLILLASVFLVVAYLFAYSYFEYKKEK